MDSEFPHGPHTEELKQRGDLNSDTRIQIRDFIPDLGGVDFLFPVLTEMKNAKSGLRYYLGSLTGIVSNPDAREIFIEFLNRFGFGPKENQEFHATGLPVWRMRFGDLLSAYRFFKMNPERFREALRVAETIEDLTAFCALAERE